MNHKDKGNKKMENSKMAHISEQAIAKKQILSTLQLWQAHLKALTVASNEPTHEVEIVDLSKRNSSTVAVRLPDGQALR